MVLVLPTAATITTVLLKQRGLRNTAVRGIRPNDPTRCRFMGTALTLRYLPLREDLADRQSLANAEALMHRVMDRIRPDTAVVIDAMAREDCGILGEMLVTRMKVLGAAGIVCDGGMRDLTEIRSTGLPLFCRIGAPPPSIVGLMLTDIDIPVSCGGVTVFPGDTVVGDEDGVSICPAEYAAEVVPAAVEQDRVERYVRLRVEAGEPMPGLYPPGEAALQAYRAWVAAGEPRLDG